MSFLVFISGKKRNCLCCSDSYRKCQTVPMSLSIYLDSVARRLARHDSRKKAEKKYGNWVNRNRLKDSAINIFALIRILWCMLNWLLDWQSINVLFRYVHVSAAIGFDAAQGQSSRRACYPMQLQGESYTSDLELIIQSPMYSNKACVTWDCWKPDRRRGNKKKKKWTKAKLNWKHAFISAYELNF